MNLSRKWLNEFVTVDVNDKDFFLIKRDTSQKCIEAVRDLCTVRLPKATKLKSVTLLLSMTVLDSTSRSAEMPNWIGYRSGLTGSGSIGECPPHPKYRLEGCMRVILRR